MFKKKKCTRRLIKPATYNAVQLLALEHSTPVESTWRRYSRYRVNKVYQCYWGTNAVHQPLRFAHRRLSAPADQQMHDRIALPVVTTTTAHDDDRNCNGTIVSHIEPIPWIRIIHSLTIRSQCPHPYFSHADTCCCHPYHQ